MKLLIAIFSPATVPFIPSLAIKMVPKYYLIASSDIVTTFS